MFKGTKPAVVLLMVATFIALALSGCMPMTSGGVEGGEDPTPSSGLMSFLPLILIIVVFYFILIRPQNKKNKQVNEMRTSLKRGDIVTTIGGFRGRIVRVKESEDMLTIEVGSDKVKLDIMRWGISKVEEAAPEKKPSKKDKDIEDEEEPAEEAPKRKPKKLTAVKKDTEPESGDEDVDEEEDDE